MTTISQTSIVANYKFTFVVAIPSALQLPATTYTLALRGPSTIDISGTLENGYATFASVVEVAGDYKYTLYAADADLAKSLIDTGMVTVARDPLLIEVDEDLRTPPQIVLDAINATILKRATKDQESISIDGRSLARTPLPDLLNLQTRYENKVKNYGRKTPRAIKTRFGII